MFSETDVLHAESKMENHHDSSRTTTESLDRDDVRKRFGNSKRNQTPFPTSGEIHHELILLTLWHLVDQPNTTITLQPDQLTLFIGTPDQRNPVKIESAIQITPHF